MSQDFVPVQDFSAGLNTKAEEDGLNVGEGFTTFSNLRVNEGVAKARKRFARIAVLGNDNQALSFDGTNDFFSAPIDTRVWALGTRFTIESLLKVADKTATDNHILYVGVSTASVIIDTSSNKLRARVWDSAAALTTVTSTADIPDNTTFSFQFKRDGATLSLTIDNGTPDTGTMDATNSLRTPAGDMRVARDNGSNYAQMTLDYLRVFSITKSDHADRLLRFPDPKASYCLADYDCRLQTGNVVRDRSRFENHGDADTAAPSEVTSLAHPHAPVQAVRNYLDNSNQRHLVILAGGRLYDVTL